MVIPSRLVAAHPPIPLPSGSAFGAGDTAIGRGALGCAPWALGRSGAVQSRCCRHEIHSERAPRGARAGSLPLPQRSPGIDPSLAISGVEAMKTRLLVFQFLKPRSLRTLWGLFPTAGKVKLPVSVITSRRAGRRRANAYTMGIPQPIGTTSAKMIAGGPCLRSLPSSAVLRHSMAVRGWRVARTSWPARVVAHTRTGSRA